MSDELSHCPFCGFHSQIINKQIPEKQDEKIYFFVECGHCEAEGPAKIRKQDAIKAWNRRAGDGE